jgi:hypothetical protein
MLLRTSRGSKQQLADWALNRMQELNIQQVEALYSLLDNNGNGRLTVNEMIDLLLDQQRCAVDRRLQCVGKPMLATTSTAVKLQALSIKRMC